MGLDNAIIQEVFIAFLDIVIFFVAANNFLKKRKGNIFIRYILIFFLFLLALFFIFNIKYLILKFTLSVTTIALIMNLIFDDKIIKVFFQVITVAILYLIVEYILYIVIKTDIAIYDLITNKEYNIFKLAILSRLIVFLIVISFVSKNKFKYELSLSQMLKFMIIVVLAALGIVSSIMPSKSSLIPSDYITTFVLIFNTIFVYYILSDFIKMSDKLRLKSLNEERIEGELNLYKELEHKNVSRKKILHDYKNTLICVKSLICKEEYKELQKYVDRLSADVSLADDYVSTNNTLVDVLINSKYEKALQQNITLVLKLDYLADLKIKDEDMIVILSNLLDNALEYCNKLKNKDKVIFLNIKQKEVLKIVVRNPIETEIVVKDNLVKTTKKGDNHGIGLGNVNDIVEKYSGNIYINTDDGHFTCLIEI